MPVCRCSHAAADELMSDDGIIPPYFITVLFHGTEYGVPTYVLFIPACTIFVLLIDA